MIHRLLPIVLLPLMAAGCNPDKPSAKVPEASESHGIEDNERLLYRPQGSPALLLGREVLIQPDGSLRVANERRAGCIVKPREITEEWERIYSAKVEDTAGGGVAIPKVVDLRARYDDTVSVAVAIHNSLRLDADIEGDCGKVFVQSVRVGTGEHFIGKKGDAEAAAAVAIKGVVIGGEASSHRESVERFAWSRPQAWSFSYGSMEQSEGVVFAARMPIEIMDGEQYEIEIKSNREAWLIVYGREADGSLFKLLPNMDHPTIHVAADEWRRLPKLQAGLRDPAVEVQEQVLVYAFDDANYAQRFEMPRGAASSAQMKAWEQQTQEALHGVAQRHWQREEQGYRIVPKTPARR